MCCPMNRTAASVCVCVGWGEGRSGGGGGNVGHRGKVVPVKDFSLSPANTVS